MAKRKRSFSEMVAETKNKRDTVSTAPNIVVNALAGTGKTFTLVVGIAMMFKQELGPAFIRGKLGFWPKPSPQQKKVWDELAKGPRPKSITYIAFNKSIVNEFKSKWAWLTRALADHGITFNFSTIHSMGYSVCAKQYGLKFGSVNKWSTRNLIERLLGKGDLREFMAKESGRVFVTAVEALVKLTKLNLSSLQTEDEGDLGLQKTWVGDEELDRLCTHYEVMVNGQRDDVFDMVRRVLKVAADPNGEINFDDQIWLPVIHQLPVPKVDLLLVDEGQDLNPCQQAIALKAGKRIILVGDIHQAIYGFAGADVDSIPKTKAMLADRPAGVVEVPLTVTRRCAKAIVRAAQVYVPEFEAHESNGEGIVRSIEEGPGYENLEAEVTDKDFILCRVNAPLIAVAFSLLKAGRKANIQGRDVGAGLKAMMIKPDKTDVGDFLDWLEDFRQKESSRIQRRKNDSEEAMVALNDKVACIQIFCEGAATMDEAAKNVDKVFKGKQCPKCKKSFDEVQTSCFKCKDPATRLAIDLVRPEGVLLSSAHRSKGLEAKRVFVLKPSLMPHPMAKTDWARVQETNLKYVTITRAINELVWVIEDPKND